MTESRRSRVPAPGRNPPTPHRSRSAKTGRRRHRRHHFDVGLADAHGAIDLRQDVATDLRAPRRRILGADRSRASGPPSSSEGEDGRFFNATKCRVEPCERPHTAVRTGLASHGRRGVARTARPDGERWPLQEANVTSFQIGTRRGRRCLAAFVRRCTRFFALWAVLSWVLIFASSRIQEVKAASPTQVVSPYESAGNQKAFLWQLRTVLGEKVGRVYYRGSCLRDSNLGISFRQLNVRPAPLGRSGVAAVRDMLRDEKNISVEEDDTGVIRIRIGRVSDAILNVRIPRLTLGPLEQYNAWAAIWAVQNSAEVRTAMHDLHIRTPNHVRDLILVKPADGLPHLADVVTDATVDQVLDMIVKTFRGTILYENCAPPDQYDIDFERGG